MQGGIYSSDLNGNEFKLLIEGESSKYLRGETCYRSMAVDSEKNIYLNYELTFGETPGTGMVKFKLISE